MPYNTEIIIIVTIDYCNVTSPYVNTDCRAARKLKSEISGKTADCINVMYNKLINYNLNSINQSINQSPVYDVTTLAMYFQNAHIWQQCWDKKSLTWHLSVLRWCRELRQCGANVVTGVNRLLPRILSMAAHSASSTWLWPRGRSGQTY